MKFFTFTLVITSFLLSSPQSGVAQGEIPRKTILMTCEGEPSVVTFAESSAGAPVIDVDALCVDALAAILATPLDEANKDWDVQVLYANKRLVNYLVKETLRIPGPAGPEGPQGESGEDGNTGDIADSIYTVQKEPNLSTPSVSNFAAFCVSAFQNAVLSGGGRCQQGHSVNSSLPIQVINDFNQEALDCPIGQTCLGWQVVCVDTEGTNTLPERIFVTCLRITETP